MNWHACCGYFTRLISHSLLIAKAHKTPGDSLSRPVTEQPDIRANECSKGDNIPKMIQELHDTHTHRSGFVVVACGLGRLAHARCDLFGYFLTTPMGS